MNHHEKMVPGKAYWFQELRSKIFTSYLVLLITKIVKRMKIVDIEILLFRWYIYVIEILKILV